MARNMNISVLCLFHSGDRGTEEIQRGHSMKIRPENPL
jgi:hypothetical protein